jgi:hypothetical protein
VSLESYRASVERAYRCIEAGHVEVGLWVIASVHDRLADAVDAQSDHDYLDRVAQAMALAPTLDICRALLRGEAVPIELLDQGAVRRFGLRKEAAR